MENPVVLLMVVLYDRYVKTLLQLPLILAVEWDKTQKVYYNSPNSIQNLVE